MCVQITSVLYMYGGILNHLPFLASGLHKMIYVLLILQVNRYFQAMLHLALHCVLLCRPFQGLCSELMEALKRIWKTTLDVGV